MKKNQVFVGLMMLVAILLVAFTFAPGAAILAAAPFAGLLSSNKMKEQRTGFETELNGFDEELKTLMAKVKTENRDYTAEENQKRTDLVAKCQKLGSDISALNKQIELRQYEESIEARVAGKIINEKNEEKENKEIRKYSLLTALNQITTNGRLEGFELEMDQEARKELRASGINPEGNLIVPSRALMNKATSKRAAEQRTVLLAGSSSGSYFVQTDVNDFISALYQKNVLVGLGAQMVTGLVGNISIPKSAGSTASWEGEVDANADATPVVTAVTAAPKRLGAYGLISKQLIVQAGNYDVEQLVQNDIISAINQALQIAAIEGSGSGEPTGILNTGSIGSVLGGTNGAAPTAAHIIDLEEAVATANADVNSLAYLTNPKVRAKLKKTAVDAGSGMMVWDLKTNNELLGYKAGVTTSVPYDLTKGEGSALSAIIFGNFADLLLLQWGGFDIVVNPYTNAKTNQLEIVINSFWDIIVRRAASFAAMKDAVTT